MTTEMEEAAPLAEAEGGTAPKAEDVETIAREMGWKPETEWKGEPPEGGFASAAEFIRSQRQHTKNVERELKKLKSDTEKRIERIEKKAAKDREAAVEKAIESIHDEYNWWIRKAIKDGDESEEQRLTRERNAQIEKAKEAGEPDEEEGEDEVPEDEWVEKFKPAYPEVQKRFYADGHSWILDDEADPDAMRVVLDFVDSGIPFAEALEKADRALRKAYPEHYESEDDVDEEDEPPRKNGKRVPVLSPGGRGNGGNVSASSKLSAEQRAIGMRFVKEGLFASLEEYAEQRLKLEA